MVTRIFQLKLLWFALLMMIIAGPINAQSNLWTVENVAGQGEEGTYIDGAAPISTHIPRPVSMATDAEGDVYFTSVGYFTSSESGVYKIDLSENTVSQVLSDVPGIAGIAINKETNMLYFSRGLSFDGGPSSIEYIYSKDLTSGILDTLAGTGVNGNPLDGYHARTTPIGGASGLKIDPTGQYLYYLAPTLGGDGPGINFIQRIDLTTEETYRVAGLGGTGEVTTAEDGDDAISSFIAVRHGFDWDSEGNLYFTTTDQMIKKIVDGKIYHVAGTGEPGYGGDLGLAAEAQIYLDVSGVYIDRATDELYFCDTGNNRIRKIGLSGSDDPDFFITTFAGTGFDEGDDGNPLGDLSNGNYKLSNQTNLRPFDILPLNGHFYISDNTYRLRRIFTCKEAQIVGSNMSPTTVCTGDVVNLVIDGELNDANQWTWFQDECLPTNVIEGENGASIDVTVDQDRSYYVRGTGGCTSVYFECFQFDVEITCNEYYNTFTPNGDGVNEFLEIPAVDNYPINVVRVYNRWGDQLEVIQNYDNETAVWRGTNGAVELGAGTYYFTAEANGILITSGWVQLIK